MKAYAMLVDGPAEYVKGDLVGQFAGVEQKLTLRTPARHHVGRAV